MTPADDPLIRQWMKALAAYRESLKHNPQACRIVMSPEFGGPPVAPRPFAVASTRAEIEAIRVTSKVIAKAKNP